MQMSIAQLVHWFEQALQSGTFPYVSMEAGSFVLSESTAERTLLYMGRRPFQGTLQTLGPLQARVLVGEVELEQVRCEAVMTSTQIHYRCCSPQVERQSFDAGSAFSLDAWQAADFSCSTDALLMLHFSKSENNRHHLCFDKQSLQLSRVSLRSHQDARLFNFIEVLARSSGERSAKLLQQLTMSAVPEIAWRALEGVSARSPQQAMALLQQYAQHHPSALISQRSAQVLKPTQGVY